MSRVSSNVELSIDNQEIKIEIGKVTQIGKLSISVEGGGGYAPVYKGEYEVIPKTDESTILQTKGMQLTKNVTVTKIPYWETTNPQGGETVYIGGDLNGN